MFFIEYVYQRDVLNKADVPKRCPLQSRCNKEVFFMEQIYLRGVQYRVEVAKMRSLWSRCCEEVFFTEYGRCSEVVHSVYKEMLYI